MFQSDPVIFRILCTENHEFSQILDFQYISEKKLSKDFDEIFCVEGQCDNKYVVSFLNDPDRNSDPKYELIQMCALKMQALKMADHFSRHENDTPFNVVNCKKKSC